MKQAKKSIGSLLLMISLFIIMLVVGGMAQAITKEKPVQDKYVLKFNHVLSESEPFHKGLTKWAQRVAERTDGKFEIQVFHSAQLGMEEDVIEQLRQGVNIGQSTDAARLGQYIPEIAVMNAPYFVDSLDDVAKLREMPTVKQWEKELEDKYGIKILSFNWVQGNRQIVANKPIKTPVDLAGLRIRTPGQPVWQETIQSLGAEPVELPFGEVYIGMEQEYIDGADLVYRNVTGARIFEVAKYINETNHIFLINFQVVSKEFFDSLPPAYQQILIEECDKEGIETSRKMEKEMKKIKKELTKQGMTIVEDVDAKAFRAASEGVYQKLNLTRVRDTLYKEMGKRQEL